MDFGRAGSYEIFELWFAHRPKDIKHHATAQDVRERYNRRKKVLKKLQKKSRQLLYQSRTC